MTEFDIALIPGLFILELIFGFFQISVGSMESGLFRTFGAVIALVFWLTLFRMVWFYIVRVLLNIPANPNNRR